MTMNSSRLDFVNRLDMSKVIDPFRRSRAWTLLALTTAAGLLVGLLYALLLALPLYASTATVVVRGGSGEISPGAATSMARRTAATGDMIALLDGFLIQDYLQSPDAMKAIDAKIGLFALFPGGSADPLHPLPGNPTPEEKLRFYRSVVKVRYSLTRQNVEIEGSARRPDQAARITQATLELSEAFINHYNERVRGDVLNFAESEVRKAEQRVSESQAEIRNLRNTTGRLDPSAEATRIGAVIQQLEIQSAAATAERASLQALGAPAGSPKMAELNARIGTLNRFIEAQRDLLVGSASAISGNISAFENADSNLAMAQENLKETRSQLADARINAARQQRYLLTISSPTTPTQKAWPHTWMALLAGAAVGLIAGMIWLLFTRAFGVD
jgi:capsular polysaccharide transport system permease protein